MTRPENATDDTHIHLTPDSVSVLLREINSILDALSWVKENVSKDTMTVSTRHNGLYIARNCLQKVGNLLGAAQDIDQEHESRLQALRDANEEVRKLREEMGKGQNVEAMSAKLYEMGQTIYNWWQNLGFTYSKYTPNAWAKGGYFHVDFSVSVDKHVSSHSETPVTDKEKLVQKQDNLAEQLVLVNDGGDYAVLNCELNQNWLIRKLQERFPGARITKWEIYPVNRTNQFQIRRIDAHIDFASVGEFEKNKDYP